MLRRRVFSFISMLIALYLTMDIKAEYLFLWMLPFGTSILYFMPVYKTKDIVVNNISIIIDGGIFIRNSFCPLLMVNYPGEIIVKSQNYINQAILLMLIEAFLILLFVGKETHRYNKLHRYDSSNIKPDIELGHFFVRIMLLLGIICFFYILQNPHVMSVFTPIWNIEADPLDEVKEDITKDSNPFDTIFYCLFGVFRTMMVLFLLYIVTKLNVKSIYSALLLLLVILTPALFTSENFGNVLISIFVIYSFVSLIYKKGVFTLKCLFLGGIGSVFIMALIMKGFNKDGDNGELLSYASSYLQGYFPGVNSVAGVFNITGMNVIVSFLYDIYFMIPFRNTLMGIPGDFRAAMYFNSNNNIISQVIPCVGQAYVYTGFAAPILSSLPIIWAYRFVGLIKKCRIRSIDFVFIFAGVYCAITPFMYNFTILGSWLFMDIAFFYFFIKLAFGLKK